MRRSRTISSRSLRSLRQSPSEILAQLGCMRMILERSGRVAVAIEIAARATRLVGTIRQGTDGMMADGMMIDAGTMTDAMTARRRPPPLRVASCPASQVQEAAVALHSCRRHLGTVATAVQVVHALQGMTCWASTAGLHRFPPRPARERPPRRRAISTSWGCKAQVLLQELRVQTTLASMHFKVVLHVEVATASRRVLSFSLRELLHLSVVLRLVDIQAVACRAWA
mmetsp:Transcript_90027/g.162391  ORF Transcript_90027/g.162391 Transcript_90027/m.162391 type:complete len:226 (+) Transcript_90027:399-1076(+)